VEPCELPGLDTGDIGGELLVEPCELPGCDTGDLLGDRLMELSYRHGQTISPRAYSSAELVVGASQARNPTPAGSIGQCHVAGAAARAVHDADTRLGGAADEADHVRHRPASGGPNTRTGAPEMAKGDIETYYEDGVWKNRPQGNERASNTAATKAEAQAVGREMAKVRGVEHVIKNKDGTIGQKNSFGNDPRQSRG
jgi:hypothetical protein